MFHFLSSQDGFTIYCLGICFDSLPKWGMSVLGFIIWAVVVLGMVATHRPVCYLIYQRDTHFLNKVLVLTKTTETQSFIVDIQHCIDCIVYVRQYPDGYFHFFNCVCSNT